MWNYSSILSLFRRVLCFILLVYYIVSTDFLLDMHNIQICYSIFGINYFRNQKFIMIKFNMSQNGKLYFLDFNECYLTSYSGMNNFLSFR